MKYNIEIYDLGVHEFDDGRFRTYDLQATGDNLYDLIMNATIFEIGRSGDPIKDYSIFSASREVEQAAFKAIEKALTNKYIVWEK